MKAFLIVFAILMLIGPVLASLVKCAPKWYKVKIKPKMPVRAQKDRTGLVSRILFYDLSNIQIPHSHWPRTVLAWVLGIIFYIPLLVILLVVGWISACMALVERKCPYTPPSEIKSRLFLKDWRSMFVEVITFKFVPNFINDL